jgi:hypothetical protein
LLLSQQEKKIKDVSMLAYNKLSQSVSSLNKKERVGHISVFLFLFTIVFFPYFIALFVYVLLFFFPSLPEILSVPSLAFILFLVGYRLVIMFGLPLILAFYGMKYKKPFLCSVVSLLPFLLYVIFLIAKGASFIVLQPNLLFMLMVVLITLGASLKNRKIGIVILMFSLILWLYQIYPQLPYLLSPE